MRGWAREQDEGVGDIGARLAVGAGGCGEMRPCAGGPVRRRCCGCGVPSGPAPRTLSAVRPVPADPCARHAGGSVCARTCAESRASNLTTPAHPLAESSTSAYEKPPTKTTPRKPSSATSPRCRSPMATSHGSRPAARNAAAISLSPLDPSCRRTATRARWPAGGAVGAGVKVRLQFGAWRVESPACSCATHAGEACRFSSSKEEASHASRSAPSSASRTTSPPTDTRTGALRSAD
eukprot:scaffold2835_cov105-Isochrysis_galbana.AAC.17